MGRTAIRNTTCMPITITKPIPANLLFDDEDYDDEEYDDQEECYD